VVVLAVLFLGSLVVGLVYSYVYLPHYYQQQSLNYYNRQLGMMGIASSSMMGDHGMGSMMGYYNGYAIADSSIISVTVAESYVNGSGTTQVFPSNDTIVFKSNHINLVILSMGHGRAFNLTHYVPPSYMHYQHNVFVIDGLINPTLLIPKCAIVNVTFINLDAGDYHNLAVTQVPPPYPYYVMMDIRMNVLGMSPMLHPANYVNGQAHYFSFALSLQQPGVLYYLCEYPGHAQMGMYGQILVT
jgi:rusticyanin